MSCLYNKIKILVLLGFLKTQFFNNVVMVCR